MDRIKDFLFIFFMVLIICCVFSGNAFSGKKVKLATGEWAPYASKSLKGFGFVSEIVSATFKAMGQPIELEFYSWKKCEYLAKQRKIFACFPYSHTEKRAEIFAFSETIAESTTKLFYYKPMGSGYVFEKFGDLKNYHIGGVTGYFYIEPFNAANFHVTYSTTEMGAIGRLMKKRGTNLLLLNELVGWHLIKTNLPALAKNFATLEKRLQMPAKEKAGSPSSNNLMLMVNKNNPVFLKTLEEFNRALASFKQTEEYRAIRVKYGLAP